MTGPIKQYGVKMEKVMKCTKMKFSSKLGSLQKVASACESVEISNSKIMNTLQKRVLVTTVVIVGGVREVALAAEDNERDNNGNNG